jgi:hypothetical protein
MARQKLPANASIEFDEEPATPPPAPAAPPGVRQALPQGAQITFDDEPAAPAAPEPEVSKLESAARGVAQGATMNFADELVGLGAAMFGNRGTAKERYQRHRDASREKNRTAKDTNPGSYLAGELGGSVASSFVPGVGVARGAGVAKAALQAGKVGALSGAGSSEAEDAAGVLRDSATSGALSAVTGGVVQRVLGNAPTRAVQRRLGDLTDGATATMRDKVVGKAGDKVDDTLAVLSEKPFKKAGSDAGQLLGRTEEAIAETGARLDAAYAKGGASAPSIPVVKVQRELDKFARGLERDPGKAPLARQVRSLMDDVWASWGDRKVVTAQDVRTLAGDVADAAFRGSPAVAPKQGQTVAREVWGKLKGMIDESLEATAAGSSAEVKALNRRLNTLMNMREAVRYKATREATESTRLKDRISGGLDLGLALADPTTFAAKKAYDIVGKPALRAADDKLADIVQRAAAGEPLAKLKERAIMMGLGPVAAEAMASWAVRTYNQVHGGYQTSDQSAAAP